MLLQNNCINYHPKIIGGIPKNAQKTGASVLMTLYDMINDNKNETENEKKITKIRHK